MNVVTWNWIAATLLTIAMALGGYQWTRIDARVTAEENRSIEFKAGQSELHSVINDRFNETFRRLDRIERYMDQHSGTSSNRGFPTTRP